MSLGDFGESTEGGSTNKLMTWNVGTPTYQVNTTLPVLLVPSPPSGFEVQRGGGSRSWKQYELLAR